MKIEATDLGELVIFEGDVEFNNNLGESLHINIVDSGFEVWYAGKYYIFTNGSIKERGITN